MIKLKKILILISTIILSSAFYIGCTDEDDNEENGCTHNYSCVTTPYSEGHIKITFTVNDENNPVTIEIYNGDFEDGDLYQTLTESGSGCGDECSVTIENVPIGDYSAKIDYIYGDKTITALDGDSIDNSSDEYCEGTCYELDNAELDLVLDIEALKEQLDGGSDDKCFIATAAYGSRSAGELATLRNFRDQYLITNSAGRMFVESYYRISPSIAEYIKQNDSLRFAVRCLLDPVVFSIRHPYFVLFMLSTAVCGIIYTRRSDKE
ncbi:MAG: hypothetical protein MUC95_06290 [Spirochaetes bacterium]|nr:hypothetical protein [Spirochaetota bacterium]